MNINAGVFLGQRNEVAMTEYDTLWLLEPGYPPRILVKNLRGMRFLSACYHGIYLAFWSDDYYGFYLYDIAGNRIWYSHINGDKALPWGIRSSLQGVTCLFDFEGSPGAFYCDVERWQSSILGCSGSTIGYDNSLQYFFLSSCDPHEGEFFEYDPSTRLRTELSPQALGEKLKQGPILMDRDRNVLPSPTVSVGSWNGMVIQRGATGIERFVVLNRGDVQWISLDSNQPLITIKGCVPHEGRGWPFRTTFEANGDNALIQSEAQAIVVNRDRGVIWQGTDLDCVTLQDDLILAQYSNGSVEVIQRDGSVVVKEAPRHRTIAVKIIGEALKIANYDARHILEIRTISLSH